SRPASIVTHKREARPALFRALQLIQHRLIAYVVLGNGRWPEMMLSQNRSCPHTQQRLQLSANHTDNFCFGERSTLGSRSASDEGHQIDMPLRRTPRKERGEKQTPEDEAVLPLGHKHAKA